MTTTTAGNWPTITEADLVDLDRETAHRTIADREIDTYVIMRHDDHPHATADIVGYAVRVTRLAGPILHNGRPTDRGWERCGYTIGVIDDPAGYARAMDLAREYRAYAATWAVVDHMYACGCRTGI